MVRSCSREKATVADLKLRIVAWLSLAPPTTILPHICSMELLATLCPEKLYVILLVGEVFLNWIVVPESAVILFENLVSESIAMVSVASSITFSVVEGSDVYSVSLVISSPAARKADAAKAQIIVSLEKYE